MFEEHLAILDEILRRIGEAGLQVSAEKISPAMMLLVQAGAAVVSLVLFTVSSGDRRNVGARSVTSTNTGISARVAR